MYFYLFLVSLYCRDKSADHSDVSSSWHVEENVASEIMGESYAGDVQGPLPPEPWEKYHNKPESGIRKL